jgi:uncharacterized protein (DUF1330 family)
MKGITMYYFVANIKIDDREEYQKYVERVDEVFAKYNGKYLAFDDNPKILEGNWGYSISVIIGFKCEADFNDWYYSKDYQEILKFRLNAAKCDTILIKGKEL